MQIRLQTLLDRSRSGEISESEEAELDEFERIEHLVVLIKTGTLSSLSPTPMSKTYIQAALRRFVCWRCNRHKGTDLGSFDPQTGEFSFLFNSLQSTYSTVGASL